MPSANKMTTPVAVDLPQMQGRYAELDDYTVGSESYREDVDGAPLFQRLPGDRRQCQRREAFLCDLDEQGGSPSSARTAPATGTRRRSLSTPRR
jgi:hypothetical protein